MSHSDEKLPVTRQLLAVAQGVPRWMRRVSAVATLSVAQCLLRMASSGVVQDVCRVKDALIRKTEAEADAADAEAKQKLARAVRAANEVGLARRRNADARKTEAEALKLKAEATATLMDAETRRLTAVAEASQSLGVAIAKLVEEGGRFGVDVDALMQMRAELSEHDTPRVDVADTRRLGEQRTG